ncbi:pyridoxamine 5'-phosphate oxidase family protein [Mycolicibacterium xanthum]|uniref:pyridoxamine 5'-phosphate oxidase family protein n=1 Tax=Mycolicibacterium xanthum TaxID=2796469 RepID=UPI0027E08733|nr:pyridoxamine 5'-phosphate oxidase family protein [Mycolicibacterium xanthum]
MAIPDPQNVRAQRQVVRMRAGSAAIFCRALGLPQMGPSAVAATVRRGENRNMTQRELEDLSPDECLRLLTAAKVGRLVYQDDLGPLAVPVNYAIADKDIVLRVEGGAKRAAMQQPMLAFEVDHVDEEQKSGWSVLVRGVGAEVDPERVPALLRAMDGHFPTPWAVGIHNVWLKIVPHTVTGRRLGAERSSPMY